VHDIVLWFAVALSVVSGLDIVISGYRASKQQGISLTTKDPNAL
jgi:hypothetical protein